MSLHRSLKDILDLGGAEPSLDLQPHVRAHVDDHGPRQRANARVRAILADVQEDLGRSGWWGPSWLDDVFKTVGTSFEDACGRWRSLFKAAKAQFRRANRIIEDAARGDKDRNEARKLRREAEAQLDLLLATGPAIMQSDFYSYRYFASEGFLPGYSFPRLPLSAFIPGRRGTTGNDEFLSRPRFLAISEFGPRNLVYHEGSRYQINRVILPVSDAADPVTGRSAITSQAKLCRSCGYFHLVNATGGPDLCESCGESLPAPITNLFRLQNVSTRRRDRINSDEEERQRQGYDLHSAVRFAESDGRQLRETAAVVGKDGPLASLSYGHAARIWRINKGWKRRRDEAELGFVLDIERGYWAKNTQAGEEDPDDPVGPVTRRVVPFVEDTKNCLVVKPETPLAIEVMASLQSALKSAIQVEFQLEDGELAAEPLPGPTDRRQLLLYESAEGGAGVLRRLVEEPNALQKVARRALEICHFDAETGADQGGPPWRRERCEAACYDCLMSYTNQPDHKLLDRKALGGVLAPLLAAKVEAAPTGLTRDEQFERLSRVAASDLERRWLRFLKDGSYRLPTDAAKLFPQARTRCDFFYAGENAVVYVDGAPHDFAERQTRDAQQQAAMEDQGYIVLRFRHDQDWEPLVKKYPSVFGAKS
jgi:very-short-patch-repair endonuclease